MKCILLFILVFSSGESLNKFLKRFEPLNYQIMDPDRTSRSADEMIHLKFHAYDRDFKLILERVHEKDSVFLKDATIEYENETMQFEWESNLVRGIIEDEDNSRAFGSIRNGIFEGVIEMSNGEELWIESSSPYNSTSSFHSFIYSTKDIEMPTPTERTKRRDFSYSNRHDNDQVESSQNSNPSQVYTGHLPYSICHHELRNQELSSGERTQHKFVRPKYQTSASKDENGIWSNRICAMSIQVDHTLYNWVFNGAGRGSHTDTRLELISIMGDQLSRVNAIFSATDFGGIKGIKFKLGTIKFWRSAEDKDNPFSKDTEDSAEYLDWHASQNHDKYCLSYIFTFRDFLKRIQGLAFSCFLCTTAKKSGHNHPSHNTGMVSFRSSGNEIPRALWHLTLAHELGHSLGSNHDNLPLASGKLESEENPECAYVVEKGHFLMREVANSGNKPNHELFSACTIRNITRNLKRLLAIEPRSENNRQTNCLIESDAPICGNGVIEKDEVCDCGYDAQECHEAGDDCCRPSDSPIAPCTLKNSSIHCSPSQGSCCNEKCHFKGESAICSPLKDCLAETKCLPSHAVCPIPKAINEGLLCDDVTGICQNGKCDGNICAAAGLKDCETTDRTCLQYCLIQEQCTSTANLDQFSSRNFSQKGRWGHRGIMKRPNVPCMDGSGYCDEFDDCRDIMNEAAVADGKVHDGIQAFGELLKEKWWIFIIVVIGAILILVSCGLFCYYKLPKLSLRSKNCSDSNTSKASGKGASTVVVVTTKEMKTNDVTVKSAATAGPSTVKGKAGAPKMTGKWRFPEIKKKKVGT